MSQKIVFNSAFFSYSSFLPTKIPFNMISDQGPDQILDTESYISTSIDGCVKLRLQDSPEILPISVPSLLEKAAKEAPEVLALSVKREDKWIKWTYKEYLQGKKQKIITQYLTNFYEALLNSK